MAHSEDLRRRVIKYVRQGGSKAEASRLFDVCRATIFAWLKQGEEHARQKPGPKMATKVDMKKLSAMAEKGTEKMLKEIAKEFSVDESTISKAMKRLGLTRKKNHTLRGGKAL